MRPMSLLTLGLTLAFSLACSSLGGDDKDDDDDDDDDDASSADADADDDGDGLSNDEEEALGSDPDSADSDGDGLDDGAEVERGTNPAFAYSVPLELGDYVVGACPQIPAESAGPTGTAAMDYQGQHYEWAAYAEGDTVSAWEGMDAYGQDVSVYHFCGNYVLVSVGAAWCGPCQDLARDLADEQEELVAEIGNFTFFEMLTQDIYGQMPDEGALSDWNEEFDLQGIPVVGPQSRAMSDATLEWDIDGYIPSIVLLSPDMRVISMDENLSGTTQIKRAIESWEEQE